MDAYDIAGACNQVTAFLDALNNWYIRRSRERFWAPGASTAGDDAGADKADAFDTLYTVLVTLSKVVAPLLPMLAEEIYAGLTGERSRAPRRLARRLDACPPTPSWSGRWTRCAPCAPPRSACARSTSSAVRLPLPSLTVAGERRRRARAVRRPDRRRAQREGGRGLDADRTAYGTEVVRPNARVLGPAARQGRPEVIKAAKAGDWDPSDDGIVIVGGHPLVDGEFELALQTADDVAAAPVRMRRPRGPHASTRPGGRARHRGHPRAARRGRGPRPGPRWCSRPARTPASTSPTASS